jgi:predicted DNA-binding protein with PD1-like motif
MKIILKESNKYIIRLDKNDELIESLTSFSEKRNVKTAYFFGIGAAKEIELAWYDVDKKKYVKKMIQEKLEVVSLQGNISRMTDKLIIHSHGIFSDGRMKTIAGHVNKLIVSATCEILLATFKKRINRLYSRDIGLNLMK